MDGDISSFFQYMSIESNGMSILTLSYLANSCAQGSQWVFLNMHLKASLSTMMVLLLIDSSTIFFIVVRDTTPCRNLNWAGLKLCNTTFTLFLKEVFIFVCCITKNTCILAQLVSKSRQMVPGISSAWHEHSQLWNINNEKVT